VLFEIPVFVVLLNLIGVLKAATLWRTWRPVTAVIFVLAAVLTTADPYTMLLLGVPLAVAYILALCLCSIFEKIRLQRKLKA
jgi:sec-independent protein translocase protein TatC